MVLFIVLSVAVVCGGIGSWVAAQKGRPGGEGFALGLLLGPLGVLVEALLPTVAAPSRLGSMGPRSPAPGPVRPRRSLRPEDEEITGTDAPAGWCQFRRASTGEVFWSPAPEPPPVAPGPKRWEKPLRQPGPDLE